MRLPKATTIATATLLGLVAPPVSAGPFTDGEWSGVYIGVNAGGGWGDVTTRADCLNQPSCPVIIEAGGFPTRYFSSLDGFLGGGQIGFNAEIGNSVLLGIEADISGSSIDGSDSIHTRGAVTGVVDEFGHVSQSIDLFGTVRGRVGYRAGRWLLFGTGGLAYAEVDYRYSLRIPDPSVQATAFASETGHKSGWTAGGGAEIKLAQRWSLKGEYLFFDLGDERLNSQLRGIGGLTADTPSRFETEGNIVRIGLNYQFGTEQMPLK